MIIRPIKRRIQPTANLRIDRSTRAGKAITTLIPFGVADYDLVTGKKLTFGSAASTHNDIRGKSLKSSGAAACASIPIDLSSYTKIAVSFWLYWDAFANNDALCMEYGANFINNSGFLIDPSSSSTNFEVGIGSGPDKINNWIFGRPSAGTWHHYAVNIDRTLGSSQSSRVWVDGVSQVMTLYYAAGDPDDSFGNNNLYLFSRNNSSLYGAGRIQNLVIRGQYALTTNDILEEYNNPWQLFEPTPQQFFISASGSTTTGTAGYGTLDATGYAPTTIGTTTGIAAYGQTTLTGQTVTGYSNTTGDVNYGQITLTGQQPTVVSGTTGTAASGTLDYTGYAPSTSSSATTGTANNGAFELTGYAPGGYGTTTGTASFGSIDLTGYTPTSYGTTTDTVNYGSLALTGYAPTSYSPGSGIITQGDIDAIANAVWAHSSAVLIEQRLLEAWGRLGLDPTAPLITGQTTITFGAIVMAMSEAAGNITVTRQ